VRHRVVCDTKEPVFLPTNHAHISDVGTGTEPPTPSRRWTVQEVIDAFARGDSFFTRSPSSGQVARIEIVACDVCGRRVIRSSPDATTDNDLDTLPEC
jgi:hypothetical protein